MKYYVTLIYPAAPAEGDDAAVERIGDAFHENAVGGALFDAREGRTELRLLVGANNVHHAIDVALAAVAPARLLIGAPADSYEVLSEREHLHRMERQVAEYGAVADALK